MIVVTGGAGFIGSNIVAGLNKRGITNILVVDDLKDGRKFKNLVDLMIADYLDKDDFIEKIQKNEKFKEEIDAIFHEGACSDTTEWDGVFMMKNNYEYSKHLFHYCIERQIPFIYASSAAVYGGGQDFKENIAFESPLNVYGYSKFLFDQYIRRYLPELPSQVAGLRYFNVYGPREQHKNTMSSVAYHFNNQIKKGETIKLFEGCDGYENGEQRRDFIYVEDVVNVNLWLYDNPSVSGIFNLGTGQSQSFNDVANAVLAWHNKGSIDYIAFPEHLKGRYQSFTQADMTRLRSHGYSGTFKTVEEGVPLYLDWLNKL